jgi:arylsulfatase A-like enzyme
LSSLLAYCRSVASVDRNIGRILTALEQFDLHRNTIVVSTSDHGYMIGRHAS